MIVDDVIFKVYVKQNDWDAILKEFPRLKEFRTFLSGLDCYSDIEKDHFVDRWKKKKAAIDQKKHREKKNQQLALEFQKVLAQSTDEELTKESELDYDQLFKHCQEKYGVPDGDYFTSESCKTKNHMIGKGNAGLVIHHYYEVDDKAGMLCNPIAAAKFPFEYQEGKNLCYCTLMEHLLFHEKIKLSAGDQFMISEINELITYPERYADKISKMAYYYEIKKNYKWYIQHLTERYLDQKQPSYKSGKYFIHAGANLIYLEKYSENTKILLLIKGLSTFDSYDYIAEKAHREVSQKVAKDLARSYMRLSIEDLK